MKLSFHGATEEVTGSCFLLETAAGNVLIDCGMKQGERLCILRTLDPFAFDVKKIVAVVVTHAHFDHTGRLPELIAQGYTGPIFMTPPTKALADIVLEDSLNIMRENAERCGDEVPYSKEDKDAMLSQVHGVNYHTAFEPAPGISIMFHDAGHILGSAYISIDVEGKRFVFSGDIGNDDVPILPDTEPLHRANYVVCEATYGDRDHEPTAERGERLLSFAKKVLGRKGTLLIPAFSVERTQELLYELDLLITQGRLPHVPIYLDSPLAIRATSIYRHFAHHLRVDHPLMQTDFFSFPSLRETLSADESKKINDDHGPKIIIAGNGMMTGGRILHHLKHYLSDARAGLLVIGFQAPGTLGRKILNKAPNVKIFGQETEVRAEVEMIGSFSAHGDRGKLARWLHPEEGSVEKIFLVHGEDEAKMSFASYLQASTQAEVLIPRMNQVYEL
ncbi:MBL fold metallo-hydrolase [bacterium]|nr:MBL fold metallo-hydrolase [bacterium]